MQQYYSNVFWNQVEVKLLDSGGKNSSAKSGGREENPNFEI